MGPPRIERPPNERAAPRTSCWPEESRRFSCWQTLSAVWWSYRSGSSSPCLTRGTSRDGVWGERERSGWTSPWSGRQEDGARTLARRAPDRRVLPSAGRQLGSAHGSERLFGERASWTDGTSPCVGAKRRQRKDHVVHAVATSQCLWATWMLDFCWSAARQRYRTNRARQRYRTNRARQRYRTNRARQRYRTNRAMRTLNSCTQSDADA